MGYMFSHNKLDMHVEDSDMAADFQHSLAEKIIAQLRNHEKVKENGCNTDGILNVAMIIDENFVNKSWQYTPMLTYIDAFIPRYEKWIAKENKMDWDDKKNQRDHMAVYNKILNRLKDQRERMVD